MDLITMKELIDRLDVYQEMLGAFSSVGLELGDTWARISTYDIILDNCVVLDPNDNYENDDIRDQILYNTKLSSEKRARILLGMEEWKNKDGVLI